MIYVKNHSKYMYKARRHPVIFSKV